MIKIIGWFLIVLGAWWIISTSMALGAIALGFGAVVLVLAQISDRGASAAANAPSQPPGAMPVNRQPNEWAENKGFLLCVGAVVLMMLAVRYLL